MNRLCGIVLAYFFFSAAASHGQSFCFASAVSYYEQIYCELQAKGETRTLPPLYQFKRNDPMTQALLLKRPAARVGIALAMPASTRKTARPGQAAEKKLPDPRVSTAIASEAVSPHRGRQQTPAIAPINEICQVNGEQIHCGARRFQLTGNLRNQRLSADALTASNKMALPVYLGDIGDKSAIETYLVDAYRRYIQQMHAIGLGGVTITYSKFHFLFFDLQDKGLNFSQRFETMYDFLKKDKARIGISEKLTADNRLTAKDCDLLTELILVCSRAGRNYLYLAVSE